MNTKNRSNHLLAFGYKINFYFGMVIFYILLLICYQSFARNSSTVTKETHPVLDHFVNNKISKFFEIAENKALSEQEKIQESRKAIEESLDFNWMANFVLGRHKRSIDTKTFDKFKECYTEYLSNIYSSGILLYKNKTLSLAAIKQIDEDTYTVNTLITSNQDRTKVIKINYIVMSENTDNNQTVKIIDIITEGISLVSSHRAEFNGVISSNGIDFLLDKLSKK